MKKRIKYMYENGNANYIEIILGAADMSDMLNRAEYIEKIMQYDRTMLTNYQDTKKQIELTKKDIENKIVELEELTEEVNYEKDTVEKLIDNKSKEVEKYNANIQQSESMVSNYSNAIVEQEALIEKLLEEERRRVEEEERRRKAEEERKRKEEERKRKEEEEKKNQEQSNNSGILVIITQMVITRLIILRMAQILPIQEHREDLHGLYLLVIRLPHILVTVGNQQVVLAPTIKVSISELLRELPL